MVSMWDEHAYRLSDYRTSYKFWPLTAACPLSGGVGEVQGLLCVLSQQRVDVQVGDSRFLSW